MSKPVAVQRASLAIPSSSSKRSTSASITSSTPSSCSRRKTSDEVCSPETKRSRPSTLFARPKSWPSCSVNSQLPRGAVHSSIASANAASSSSTSTGITVSARSSGVGRGMTSSVGMPPQFPAEPGRKREQEARRVRPAGGARPRPFGALRRRRREDRELHQLLLVRSRDRDVPSGPRRRTDRRPARTRAAGLGAAPRDRLPRGASRRGDRGPADCPPLRGAGLRRLSAAVRARLSTDGGARGNPGPAAYGYVLETDDGTVLAAHGEAIGVATNNVAEYSALVAGLEKALELGISE